MDEIQNFIQRNLRRILAGGGFVLSIFAISLLLNTSPKSTFWLMTHSVSVGSKILPGDVATLKANLTSDSTHFEGSGDAVVGQYATRSLQSGDLIAVTDISHTGISTPMSFLPIGVAVDDLPMDLVVGDLVDIYVIPKDLLSLPTIVAHRVVVQSVDQKSRSLGGNVAVSVTADASITSIIVTAESQGRLVLARDSI